MGRRKPLPKEPIAVTIDSMSDSGLGLGHETEGGATGLADVIAVKGALPGERVYARLRSRRRRRVMARLETLEQSSPLRVEPRCPAFFDCGGCAWQHIDAATQLARKERILRDMLEARGIVPEHVDPPISGRSWGYRHKARLGVRWVPAAGGALVGFREFDSSKVTRMAGCPVLAPSLDRLIEPLKALVAGLSEPRRIPQIEVAAGDDRVAVIVRHLEPLSECDRTRLQAFAECHRVLVMVQPGGPDSVVGVDGAPCEELLGYRLGEFELRFRPNEFTQVNPEVNRLLVGEVLAGLALTGHERVLDLFCGIGNFSLPLAARAAAVIGFEGSPELVDRARANASANGIDNASFEVLDLHEPGGYPEGRDWLSCDALVVDPPRSGLSRLAEHLAAYGPERLAYVSCSPSSLVTDLVVLIGGGYRIERLRLFDMFPHTSHIETLVLLRRSWSS